VGREGIPRMLFHSGASQQTPIALGCKQGREERRGEEEALTTAGSAECRTERSLKKNFLKCPYESIQFSLGKIVSYSCT